MPSSSDILSSLAWTTSSLLPKSNAPATQHSSAKASLFENPVTVRQTLTQASEKATSLATNIRDNNTFSTPSWENHVNHRENAEKASMYGEINTFAEEMQKASTACDDAVLHQSLADAAITRKLIFGKALQTGTNIDELDDVLHVLYKQVQESAFSQVCQSQGRTMNLRPGGSEAIQEYWEIGTSRHPMADDDVTGLRKQTIVDQSEES